MAKVYDPLLAIALPPMPFELADHGLCASHPEPGLWASDKPAERKAAQRVCWTCPVIMLCAEWAAHLPARCRVGVVYAGKLPGRWAGQAYDDQAYDDTMPAAG